MVWLWAMFKTRDSVSHCSVADVGVKKIQVLLVFL